MKECTSCGKLRKIKGHGMCENCYNIAYWKWSVKRTTRTFAEAMSKTNEPSTEVMQVIKKARTERQKAIDRADKYFSRYIRLKYSFETSEGLKCRCYTCGRVKDIKDIDNGHYINREELSVRWNDDDARPQCKHCNRYRSGKHFIFEQNLIAEIGQDGVYALKRKAQVKVPVSTFQINTIASYYREEAKKFQDKLGVKVW